ncbi:hypothetical protein EJB05_01617, partial [Eragrostis curvula]
MAQELGMTVSPGFLYPAGPSTPPGFQGWLDEPSLPIQSGMCASDQVQVWDAISSRDQRIAQLEDALRAADHQHAGEVARLKAELLDANDKLTRVNKERAYFMDHLGAAKANITKLEEEVRNAEVSAKKKVHAARTLPQHGPRDAGLLRQPKLIQLLDESGIPLIQERDKDRLFEGRQF